MELYIEQQKELLNNKIDKALINLEEQLNDLNFKSFQHINQVLNTIDFLKNEQKYELLNFIFNNRIKDDKECNFKGEVFKSQYLLTTFILQDHFFERNNEFDNLCSVYLGSNHQFYKSLPVSE